MVNVRPQDIELDASPGVPDRSAAAARENFGWVQLRTPLRHKKTASQLQFVRRAGVGDSLFPFASKTQRLDVVMPAVFEHFLNTIATATYFNVESTETGFYVDALRQASERLVVGGAREETLLRFSGQLYRHVAEMLSMRSEGEKTTISNLCDSALKQVVMHECAHHYLGHFDRMRMKEITREDAEFEADLFAVLNGIEAGEPPSSMYYFFKALADIEASTHGLGSVGYESFSQRNRNITSIVAYLGAECSILVDAAFGGGFHFRGNSAEHLRSACNNLHHSLEPDFDTTACGRIAATTLITMRSELHLLLERLANDAELLFSADDTFNISRATGLVEDLIDASKHLQHLNGVAAKCLALFLRRQGLQGRALAPITDIVEMLADDESVAGVFHCGDIGRIHQAIGLSILQERIDLKSENRLDLARTRLLQAVALNPEQSEAWINLAFVAFKQGHGDQAASFADSALATLTDEAQRSSTQYFMEKMREFAYDNGTCIAMAAEFHPYDGL